MRSGTIFDQARGQSQLPIDLSDTAVDNSCEILDEHPSRH